ncbi:DNA polymerase III subunit delta [Radiobacillus kanasensis]|uniref:DNA polymerase III subunit delta n=1 Tax=Radiobacillus kanasensis TaxID=2844358 RepID=UPI001E2BC7F2|nr:DNA polymerase III subunit delta [Radiobacillus kanasensis]UFT97834.1 DNA polymerase III subunit delta [Radiobacillus kanasensis]
MTYLDTIKKIKKKQFSPVYLLHGTEAFLMEKVKKQLIKHVMPNEDRDTNISTYDLEEVSIQEVIYDVETYPFLGERKLIFANQASFLQTKPDKSGIEHNINLLQSYLSQPVDFSILVLIAPYEKLDERKKITKLLKQHSEVVTCEPVKEWDLHKWVKDIALQLNVYVDDQALPLFSQEIGTNLSMLEKELEKLALYVGENGNITKDVAQLLLSRSADTTGLQLVDAVIEKNLSKAISIYKDLEKAKEDPIALLALLASQFRTITHVKVLKQKGYSQQQMAQQLKVHPYVIKISASREASFQMDELRKILDIFAETDARIKQGKVDKQLAFEILLYQLIHIKASIA